MEQEIEKIKNTDFSLLDHFIVNDMTVVNNKNKVGIDDAILTGCPEPGTPNIHISLLEHFIVNDMTVVNNKNKVGINDVILTGCPEPGTPNIHISLAFRNQSIS